MGKHFQNKKKHHLYDAIIARIILVQCTATNLLIPVTLIMLRMGCRVCIPDTQPSAAAQD